MTTVIPDRADVLIIGSGIAGLRTALAVADHADCLLITKKEAIDSNSNHAQGGIATAVGPNDRPELHMEDTLKTGVGLCEPEAVDRLVNEGPEAVRELLEFGAKFNMNEDGSFDLGREGGHGMRRIVRAADQTGHEVERALLETALAHPRITISTFHFAVDLWVEDRRVVGVHTLDPSAGVIRSIGARVVLLASGGAGRVFRFTTNPDIATGDGIAMAYRAGAEIRDMEFVQFHPTALCRPGAEVFLISEAVRGEGAILKTPDGERFMSKYDERLELAPRDIVARAIDAECKGRGFDHVLLDATVIGAERIRERFPTITHVCMTHGIDITKEPIPVVPAAHYLCGGIATDLDGRTTLDGLFAVGETASHGIHGANRLASNSLLEALVFSKRAAKAILEILPSIGPPPEPPETPRHEGRPICGLVALYIRRLQDTTTKNVGIVRTSKGLEEALDIVTAMEDGIDNLVESFAPERSLFELADMATVARLIIESALERKESRGLHYSLDYPKKSEEQARHTVMAVKHPYRLRTSP